MTPAPLQAGQAPSEFALNSAGFTPLALANALRIGSSSPVYVAGLLRREPRIARLVDDDHALASGDGAVDQRALARPGHPGDHARARRAGCRRRRPAGCCVVGAADLERTGRRPDRLLQRRLGRRGAGRSRCRSTAAPSTVPSKHDLAAAGPGTRPEVDHVVGDRDRLRLVLDHEHGVALVAQPQQQVVHPLDVVRVQADRRLVEDVGDVGQRRARGAGSSSCAAPRRRTACPTAGPGTGSRGRSRRRSRERRRALRAAARTDGSSRSRSQSARSLICIAQASAMLMPADLGRPGLRGQPGAVAVGAGAEGGRALDEGPHVRLQRVDVLGQHGLLDLRDHALVGEVDALDLDLGGLLVEQVVAARAWCTSGSACPGRRSRSR